VLRVTTVDAVHLELAVNASLPEVLAGALRMQAGRKR